MSAGERPAGGSEPVTPTPADVIDAEGERARHGDRARAEPTPADRFGGAKRPAAEPEPVTPTPADVIDAEGERARHGERARPGPEPLGAEEARQGRIVLNTPVRRWVFISGLVGLVILAILAAALV